MQKLAVPGKSSGAGTEKEAVGVLLLHVGDYVLSQSEGMATVVAHLLRLVLAYDNMCSRQAIILILSVLWIRIRIDLAHLDPDPYGTENANPDQEAWKVLWCKYNLVQGP
jgi:hypothetical protein